MKRSLLFLALAATSFLSTGCATVASGMDWAGNMIQGITPEKPGLLNTVGTVTANIHHLGADVVRGDPKVAQSELATPRDQQAVVASPPAEAVAAPSSTNNKKRKEATKDSKKPQPQKQ